MANSVGSSLPTKALSYIYSPFILKLDAGWRKVVNMTLRLLFPLDKTQGPIKQQTCWAPEPAWKLWRRELSPIHNHVPISLHATSYMKVKQHR